MELKQLNAKDIKCLTRVTDIQRWYNVLHSLSLVCGVYTVQWERFTKTSCMEDTWSLASVTQTILDREELMYAAMHSLLSCTGVFKGNCEEFCHLILNRKDNGYLDLYQIMCVHTGLWVKPRHILHNLFTKIPKPSQKMWPKALDTFHRLMMFI
jgi:hypothetical protein